LSGHAGEAQAEMASMNLPTCRPSLDAFMACNNEEFGGGELEGCTSAGDIAKKACNTTQMLGIGMSPESEQMVEMALTQAATIAQQLKDAGGQADACKKAMDLSDIVKSVSAAKGAICGATMGRCNTRCDDFARLSKCRVQKMDSFMTCLEGHPKAAISYGAINGLRHKIDSERGDATKKVRECERYSGSVNMAVMQAMNLGNAAVQMKQCAALSSVATPTPVPWSDVPMSTGDLGLSADAGGCSGANASSSLVCICQNDPSNTLCGGAIGGPPTSGAGTGPGAGPGTPGRPYSAQLNGSSGKPIDMSQATAKNSGGLVEGGNGNGGGLPAMGAGSGGNGFGDGGGSGGNGVDKNVIQGVSSGGGGLAGGGGSGGGYGGGGYGNARSKEDDKGWFNLKKFLPNKKDYKNRGLAGMSIPATDGVTGPMGPSIWEKVTNQYQVQKPKLINDR
jgi:hypothetical protein